MFKTFTIIGTPHYMKERGIHFNQITGRWAYSFTNLFAENYPLDKISMMIHIKYMESLERQR